MLREVFESGRPLTYIRSAEEQRVGNVLREAGRGLAGLASVPVFTWSLTSGMHGDKDAAQSGTSDPRAALEFIAAHKGAAIFHLKDFHEPLRDSAEIRRRLRDIHESCLDQLKFVVITSPVRFIPEELERSIMYLDSDRRIWWNWWSFCGRKASPRDELNEPAASGRRGAPGTDARRGALCVAPRAGGGRGTSGPESLPVLLEEKRLLINRSGVIECISDGNHLGEVGGLEGLKKWLLERAQAFSDAR